MIILGIDPGSRVTGFGIIRLEGNQSFHLHHGCIRLTATDNYARLHQIFEGLKEIIQQFKPEEAAIEEIFMHQNPNSALKLGQARGAAMAAIQIPIAEYSARQVKQSVVGFGAAKKEQVQHMVKTLLNLNEKLQADAADALAIALCHAHSRFYSVKVKKSKRRSSWRNYKPKE